MGPYKIKKFCTIKETNQSKESTEAWEDIFVFTVQLRED